MSVDSVGGDYQAMADGWRTARDCAEGSHAVKAAGARYLPPLMGHKPTGLDDPYWSYVKRALFYEATGRTIDGVVGMVFRKSPIIEVPDAAEALVSDCDLMGRPFEDFARSLLREVVTTGRAGVLVDHTTAETELRPYLKLYPTEEIFDVVEDVIGGACEPVMVRLRECYERPKEGEEFEVEEVDQIRVLDLLDGVYRQRLFRLREDERGGESYQLVEEVVPVIDGAPLDYIPFWIFSPDHGAGPRAISPPPLIGLCEANLTHYRQDADLRNALHHAGVPTMFISGHDPEDKTVHVGASPVYFMPDPAAKAYYVSYGAEGAAAISKALDDLQQLMATLGARILQPDKRAVEAAETAQIHRQGEISVLANIAHGINLNLTQALQLMLTWALYEDVDDAKIELSTDFVPVQAQPQMLAELVKAWQARAISHESLWTFAQGGELVDPRRTAEEERELIREEEDEEPDEPVPGTVIGPDGTPIPPQPAPALVPAPVAAEQVAAE